LCGRTDGLRDCAGGLTADFVVVFPQQATCASSDSTMGSGMVPISPDQEQTVVDALIDLGALETEQGLHAEGVRAVQGVLQCSIDDARAVLRDLRARKCIEETATPNEHGGEQAHVSAAHFRWVRRHT